MDSLDPLERRARALQELAQISVEQPSRRPPPPSRGVAPLMIACMVLVMLGVIVGLLCMFLAMRGQAEGRLPGVAERADAAPSPVPGKLAEAAPRSAAQPAMRPPVVRPLTDDLTRREGLAARVSSVQVGYIYLRPITAELRNSKPKTIFDHAEDLPYVTSVPLLAVVVEIVNEGRQPVTYQSWNARNHPILRTADGALLPFMDLGQFEPVDRCPETLRIEPGASVRDALVFKRPVDRYAYLELELPGQNLSLPGPVRTRIAPQQVGPVRSE